jgi:hypothetical protein
LNYGMVGKPAMFACQPRKKILFHKEDIERSRRTILSFEAFHSWDLVSQMATLRPIMPLSTRKELHYVSTDPRA